MTAVEIKEVAKKYHLRFLSNSGRAQAWALFEQGLEPAELVSQNLLPGLREITIIFYYSEWGRRQKLELNSRGLLFNDRDKVLPGSTGVD